MTPQRHLQQQSEALPPEMTATETVDASADSWAIPAFKTTDVMQWVPSTAALSLTAFANCDPIYGEPWSMEAVDTGKENRSTAQRAARRGGRPYLGCLTCRERKIKCDGRRPRCLNCERSRRHTCRGFLDSRSVTSRRPGPPFDRSVPTPSFGPFSFDHSDEGPDAFGHGGTAVSQFHELDSVIAEGNQFHGAFRAVESSEDSPRPPSAFISPENERMNPQSSPDRRASLASGCEPPEDSQEYDDCSLTDCPSSQSGWGDQDLIRHYRQNVCQVLMPTVHHSKNPWVHIYSPLALEQPGCPATLSLRNSILAISALNLAWSAESPIPDLLERASSFTTESKRLITEVLHGPVVQAENHKIAVFAAALTLIISCGFDTKQKDFKQYLDLARKVMAVTGSIGFWRLGAKRSILFQIFRCYELIATTAQERSSARVVEGEEELELAEAQTEASCDSQDRPATPTDSSTSPHDDFAMLNEDLYVLNSSFGIGLQTISLLHRILRMDRQFSRWDPHGGDDVQLIQDFENVRQQLFDISNNPSAFGSPFSDDCGSSFGTMEGTLLSTTLCDELLENHQCAFHCATILFFGRLFETPQSIRWNADHIGSGEPTWTKTKSPFTNYQVYVSRILDCLENLECLTRGTTTRPANTLWPAFIAGAEAIEVDARQRSLIWFRKASRRGFANATRAKQLLQAVWRRVDRNIDANGNLPISRQGLSRVDWRHVMEELGPPIMLT